MAGANDTNLHEYSYKHLYEDKLAGNEGSPMSRYDNVNSEHFAYIVFEPTRYEKALQPYINAYGPSLRIPVSPSTLAISKEAPHTEVRSIMFGGILERNAPGLRHFSVTSFIPGTPYTTTRGDYGFQNYYPWAEDLGGGQRVYTNGTLEDDNLICTQTGWISFVNLLMDRRIILKFHLIKAPAFRHRDECFNVCIKSFTYQHNPHDDLDYTIEFIEWKEPTIRIGTEQVIDATPDEPQKPKAPSGGQILLVMHQFQGVNTVHVANGTQLLIQIHGKGKMTTSGAGYEFSMSGFDAEYMDFVEKRFNDECRHRINCASVSDVDFRPTKITSVTLGLKPNNMSGGLNALGYKAYALSQLTTAEFNSLLKRLSGLKISDISAQTGWIEYAPASGDFENAIRKMFRKLGDDMVRKIEDKVFPVIRETIKQTKFLSPKPLKLYDGGAWTGYGEKGDTLTYDGTVQHFPMASVKGTDNKGDLTKGEFTRNPALDASNQSMNVNRSGLHKLVIDETGYVRYDDLVRRVRKFKIPLKDCAIGIQITDMFFVARNDGSRLFAQCTAKATVTVTQSQVSSELYSTVDTIGNKLHKGQRITVLDSHLRAPTKTETTASKQLGEWNKVLKR